MASEAEPTKIRARESLWDPIKAWWLSFKDRNFASDPLSHMTIEQRINHKAAEDAIVLLAYLSRQVDGDGLWAQQLEADYITIPKRVLEGSYEDVDAAKLSQLLQDLVKRAAPATPESVLDSSYAERLGLRQRREWSPWILIIYVVGILAFVGTFGLGLYVSLTDTVVADQLAGNIEFAKITRHAYEGTRLEAVLGAGGGIASSEALPDTAVATDAASANPSSDSSSDTTVDVSTLEDGAVRQITNEATWRGDILEQASSLFGWLVPSRQSASELGNFAGPSIFSQKVTQRQVYINKIITGFFLPISASLTGALVYIMRDRGRREENTSLEVRASRRYLPRLLTAIIAGIIVGWFTGRDNSGILATLTPAAGAFIVGYSLEIFFNLLDSVKTALGVKDT